MCNYLVSLIFLAGAAVIVYRVCDKRSPRVCLAYAAGIVIMASCSLITGRTLNICAAAPLFTLAFVVQRKEK